MIEVTFIENELSDVTLCLPTFAYQARPEYTSKTPE